MTETTKWITPFTKQCFVVVGTSINMSQVGMTMGYASSLLPQLRSSTSIPVDDAAASWIAALPAFGLILGNLAIPFLMDRFGRRKSNLFSIVIVTIGWCCLIVATNLPSVLIGRLLQGISCGMSSCLAPLLIGEYSSPKNRGALSILMGLIMAAATFSVHAIGSYATWKVTAFVCAAISVLDFMIVIFSPESPSWLADKEMHAECEEAFKWLRGSEEEELAKVIGASKSRQANTTLNLTTILSREFYKPIVIMMHLYTMGQWAGINILAPYIDNLVKIIAGDVNIPAVVISIDAQRMMSCVLAAFIIRRVRRRTMLFVTVGINCLVLLAIAGYVYAKQTTQFGHPAIGIALLHLLMMTIAIGSLPLPFTIAGEIFPLKYKGLSSGISSLFCSINIFLPVKTYPYLEKEVGLQGACCIYVCILVYCLVVIWFLLPETKDRTLQDIEDEFRGKVADVMSAQPLRSEAEY